MAFLAAAGAMAQQSPNASKGFGSNDVMSGGDVDHVNIFNGSLNIAIPIGPVYSVGGPLSYRFQLTYSGNNWRYDSRLDPQTNTNYTQVFIDTNSANAGLGWGFSLGKLSNASPLQRRCYTSPDGAQHCFEPKLHDSDSDTTKKAGVWYTRDGTYLRLRELANSVEIDFPVGVTHTFALDGAISGMRDAFGNSVSITYPDSTDTECNSARYWLITDSAGRTNKIYFRQAALGDVLCRADLPAWTPQTQSTQNYASYRFTTSDTDISRLMPGAGPPDPLIPGNVTATLLTSVTEPDGTSWTANTSDYDTGDGVHYAYLTGGAPLGFSGNIKRLVLPTLGSIAWDYQLYSFSTGADDSHFSSYANVGGVFKRRLYSATGTLNGVWRYDPRPAFNYYAYETISTVTQRNSDDTVPPGTDNNAAYNARTVQYFNMDPTGVCPYCNPRLYGMPMTMRTAAGRPNPDGSSPGRYLSSELYDSSGSLVRRTWMRFEADAPVDVPYYDDKLDQRMASMRVDDANGASVTTDLSDFDGLGHYRVEKSAGFGSSITRTSTTAYNKADPLVHSGAAPNVGSFPGSFVPIPDTSPWALNTFSSTLVEETANNLTRSVKALYQFNPTTSLLERQRIMAAGPRADNEAPAIGTNDIIVGYTYTNGNLSREESYGGDASAQALDVSHPLWQVSLGTPEFRLDHTSVAGLRSSTTYYDTSAGAAMPFKSVDRTIDPYSGLITSTRDTAGVQTTFEYDATGRQTTSTPDARAATSITYSNPSVSGTTFTPGKVHSTTAVTDGSGTIESETQFDDFGRTLRLRRKMPDGSWVTRKYTYDSLGRKATESEQEASTDPTHYTTIAYDGLGRLTSALATDGAGGTVSYTGGTAISRTSKIFNGTSSSSPSFVDATTQEAYDFRGHMTQLTDANNVVTSYTYDVMGHLTKVCMNTAASPCQTRDFYYDGRGFLTKEVQPETGTFTYTYDSRGHMLGKIANNANTPFDLQQIYDKAERLKEIDSRNPYAATTFRPSKEFTFGTTPGTPGFGKIATATRHNYIPSEGDITVTDTFGYTDAGGAVTDKSTTIRNATYGTAIKTLAQSRIFSDSGAAANITYPSCTSNCGVSTWGALVSTLSNGGLKAIGGFASNITYAPSGMVATVVHANGVTDTYESDGSGRPRPKTVQFGNFSTCAAPGITSQPSTSPVPYGSSATITVSASGTSAQYQWYDDTAQPISGATGSTYVTPPLTQAQTYYVRIFNSCGLVMSNMVTTSFCTPPTISSGPQSQTINYGAAVALSVTPAGTGPFSYYWYQGTAPNGTLAGSGYSTFVTPNLYASANYWVKVVSACGQVNSATAVITIPLPVPAALAATATSTSSVSLSWGASTGANHYELWRRTNGTQFSKLKDVTGVSTTDSLLAPSTSYVYEIRAVDANGGSASSFSNLDVATTIMFTPITTTTRIAFAHFDQVLAGINAVRLVSGWTALTWNGLFPTPPPSAPASNVIINKAHVTALRTKLDEALLALGMSTTAYTDPSLTGVPIKRIHIQDLRDRMQ